MLASTGCLPRKFLPTMSACVFLTAVALTAATNIVNVDELSAAINNGDNKRVAFLSEANYDSVHNVIPRSVEPVYLSSTGDMIARIMSGDILAGLISGLPEAEHAPSLNTFSSTVVSTRAMLMAPTQSPDMPHGTVEDNASSYHLSLAVDAAIVSLQRSGRDEEIRLANMPFEFIAVHTCKGSDMSAFVVPNYSAATGLLRETLDNLELKVGALGPYNWGGNDGDYTVEPYRGFYPDWLTEFCSQFNQLSGPDGVRYNSQGEITCSRVWRPVSGGVFQDLFDGASYVTEPYYIVDSFYTGTGEVCTTSSDCRPAVSGTEQCTNDTANTSLPWTCSHPSSPRTRHFRISCTTIGVDSTFMTKRHSQASAQQGGGDDDDGDLSTGIIILLAVLGLLVVAFCVLSALLIHREKSGNPLFNPLRESGPGGGQATSYGNSA